MIILCPVKDLRQGTSLQYQIIQYLKKTTSTVIKEPNVYSDIHNNIAPQALPYQSAINNNTTD